MIALVERLQPTSRASRRTWSRTRAPRCTAPTGTRGSRRTRRRSDQRRGRVPHAWLRSTRGRGSTWRWRRATSGSAGGCTCPRARCSTSCAEHIAAEHRRAVAHRRLTRVQADVRRTRGEQLSGYARLRPRSSGRRFLKYKQFFARLRAPGGIRDEPVFYRTLVAAFRTLAPLVEFLNEPLSPA